MNWGSNTNTTQPMTTKDRNTRRDEMAMEYAMIGYSNDLMMISNSTEFIDDGMRTCIINETAAEAYLLADAMLRKSDEYGERDARRDRAIITDEREEIRILCDELEPKVTCNSGDIRTEGECIDDEHPNMIHNLT